MRLGDLCHWDDRTAAIFLGRATYDEMCVLFPGTLFSYGPYSVSASEDFSVMLLSSGRLTWTRMSDTRFLPIMGLDEAVG